MSTEQHGLDDTVIKQLQDLSLDLCKVPTTQQIGERLTNRAECLRMATDMHILAGLLLALHDIPGHELREQIVIKGSGALFR